MNIFNSLKSNLVKPFANNFLKDYGGEIIDLSIDKENGIITATIALEGEIRPVHITLNDINIITEKDASFLSFKNVVVDRKWISAAINTLLKQFVPENKIEIPGKFSGILKMLI
jgi:hypothetical protein